MSDGEYKKLMDGRKNTDDELNYRSYIDREQLNIQGELKRDFLLRFEEGQVTFPPTYKIGRTAMIQAWVKMSTVERGFRGGPTASSTGRGKQ